jgi:integrase
VRKALSAKVLENVKPPARGRLELWDAKLPGFGLRITDKDARTWFVMYRTGIGESRRQRRLRIGDAAVMKLGDARELAEKALRKVDRGIDPATEIEDDYEPDATAGTVRAVAEDYLARYVRRRTRPSTYKETKRIFDVDVLPVWGDRQITSIDRAAVRKLADAIAARGAEVQANRIIARLKTFFAWAADEDQAYLASSPTARMKPVTKETERDRVLSNDEIRWFWQGCDAMGWPFGGLFRLLLLTAQRRDEVGGLAFPELNVEGRLWTIPRERAKNDRAHEVQLSDLAHAELTKVLKQRRKFAALKDSPLVFTTTGETSVSGFSRAKERLDAEMEKLARRARQLPEEDDALRKALRLRTGEELPRFVPEWILHDLRRTAATGMAKLNIPPHVVDKILNHVSGAIRGVAAVYNRHAYMDERQAALEAWGRRVAEIVSGGPENVVRLAPGSSRRAAGGDVR